MTRDLRPKDVRRYLSALAVGGAVAVVTHPALATEPASPDPVTFEWTAPTVCPDREAVLARLRRNGAAAEGESPIHARVTVEELATDHYRAHVATAGGPDRVLDATSCEAIADAVAVILRVAAHAPEPRSTPASTPSTTPASANTPANTPANMPAIAPATELAPTPATALTPIEKGGRGSGFSARAAIAYDVGTRYRAEPGFRLGLAWRRPPLTLVLDVSAFAPPSAPDVNGVEVGVGGFAAPAFVFPPEWLLTATTEACLGAPLAPGTVRVDLCAGVAVEHPRFEYLAGPKIGVVPVGEASFEWWPLPYLGASLAFRFLLDVPRATPSDTLVAFEPSLGLIVRFAK